MKWSVLLLPPLLLTACSPGKDASSNAVKAEPAKYALRSNIVGASLVRIDALPTVTPYGENGDDYCGERVAARTAAGKSAEQKGWRVVQETKFHGLDALLIVRGYDPGTSSHCFSKDPNLVFLEGEKIVGVLYSKGKNGIGINAIEIVGDHLRVWDDNMAIGQLNLADNRLTFDSITGSDPACKGKYQVPVVFGQPYSKARRILGKAGWVTSPSTEDAGGDERTESYRTRFPEADYCSGTGYAYCRFSLKARDGKATLFITTTGEDADPVATAYAVSCDGAKPD